MPCRCVPAVDITVYRTPTSIEGIQAQEYFLRRGLAFQDLDVSINPQAMKEMGELSGQKDRPVVLVNRRVFVGFNPDELDLVVPSLF